MAIFRNSCSFFNRLSKKSLLSLVRSPLLVPVLIGEIVEYTNPNGVSKQCRVESIGENLITLSIDGILVVVEKSEVSKNKKKFILDKIPESDWDIISFDNKKRTVCVEIKTVIGKRTISISLPVTNNY